MLSLSRKSLYPFKLKLGFLLFSVVLLMSGLMGAFQYFFVKHLLESNFEQNRRMIEERVRNTVADADRMNLLVERPMEQEARPILEAVRNHYLNSGQIGFDLKPFVADKPDMDLYIIDQSYTVIASTNTGDIGLNFQPYSDFTRYLDGVVREGGFAGSRISLSLNGSNLTKYCYLPSGDGRYIFETGALIDPRLLELKTSTFENFETAVVRENTFIDRVILYDYLGVSYKKEKNGLNYRIDEKHSPAFAQAMDTLQTVETEGVYEGQTVIYQYVPYQLVNAAGNNEISVIEIIYNEDSLRQSLFRNLLVSSILVIAAACIAGSYGFYRSRSITRPLQAIASGIRKIARGDYDVSLDIRSTDEFAVLGRKVEQMAVEIRELLGERSRIQHELESSLKENQNSYFETVRALVNAIEVKDAYTRGHCERVMDYSLAIGRAMNLTQQELHDLRFGSILHDIGKIGIPEHILNNQGSFSPQDFEMMKRHPAIGDKLLEGLHFLDNSRKIVHEHHERVDGTGYPQGLKGEEIGLMSKIVSVADAYDAMTSDRPYRKTVMSSKDALQELERQAGTQFDARVVRIFVMLLTGRLDLNANGPNLRNLERRM
jgi:HD-GYP domain-containing protein (c-di-GMP phosphodiesterase class II)